MRYKSRGLESIATLHPLRAPILGTRHGDTLSTLAEGDRLFGLGSSDLLLSFHNSTALHGGPGDDQLTTEFGVSASGTDSAVALALQFGGKGKDTLVANVTAEWTSSSLPPGSEPGGAVVSIKLAGGRDDDTVTATAFASTEGFSSFAEAGNKVWGGAGNDTIDVTALAFGIGGEIAATNIVYGGLGDDIIDAVAETDGVPGRSKAENIIHGGLGDDTITARADGDFHGILSTAINTITGGLGNDSIDAVAIVESNGSELAANWLDGGLGNDTLRAFTLTNSNVSSPIGTNTLFGGAGNDVLMAEHIGSSGNAITTLDNMLDGGSGHDVLTAEILAGAEFGASGVNLLYGGRGDDSLTASVIAQSGFGSAQATNHLYGGAGDDHLTAYASAFVFHEGPAEAENFLDGGSGDDVLEGAIGPASSGHSILRGGAGNDQLTVIGGSGNVLDGGDGNDDLTGGDGEDEFRGGSGDDEFLGGLGVDTFVFDVTRDEETETLLDFDRSEDRLGFLHLTDENDPGLGDDLDAITTVTDAGPGGDVTVQFDAGTVLVFKGVGTGAIDSIADLVDDPLTQLIGLDDGFSFV